MRRICRALTGSLPCARLSHLPEMPRELLSAYPVAGERYDEMFSAPATPRPHWARLYADLQAARRSRSSLPSTGVSPKSVISIWA